jgi:CubicO group peptidase (beta-lactamase class C family)
VYNGGTMKPDTLASPKTRSEIDRIAQHAMKVAKVPGMAIAVVSGEESYVQGYGIKDIGTSEPVTERTVFAIASVSKAFTTALMASLVGEKAISWDDPVRKHLPEFHLSDPLADAHVTLRDLVCHRTGMPRHDMLWYRSPWDRSEVLRRFAQAAPNKGFRQVYQYQNICFAAAGEACARAAGAESFEALLTDRLLNPLGMTSTTANRDAVEDAPDRATPHRRDKQKRLEITPWRSTDNVGPCGSVNSCASDMAKWLRFQLSGGLHPETGEHVVEEKALKETHIPQMVIPEDDDFTRHYPDTVQRSYGLGWSILDYRGGHKLVRHGGVIGGFRAQAALLPRESLGVVVMINAATWLAEPAANMLIDYLLGLPKKAWVDDFDQQHKKDLEKGKIKKKEKQAGRHRRTSPSLKLSEYAGTYQHPAYGDVIVSLADSSRSLHLSWSDWSDYPLRHWHHNLFVTEEAEPDFADVDVSFTLNVKGEVASLTLLDTVFPRAPKES